MSNKRGLSGIYLILIVFGIALLLVLSLDSLEESRKERGLYPSPVVNKVKNNF